MNYKVVRVAWSMPVHVVASSNELLTLCGRVTKPSYSENFNKLAYLDWDEGKLKCTVCTNRLEKRYQRSKR